RRPNGMQDSSERVRPTREFRVAVLHKAVSDDEAERQSVPARSQREGCINARAEKHAKVHGTTHIFVCRATHGYRRRSRKPDRPSCPGLSRGYAAIINRCHSGLAETSKCPGSLAPIGWYRCWLTNRCGVLAS